MRGRRTAGAVAVALALGLSACAGSGSTGNGTDRAFTAAMIPHHEAAVQMAQLAERRGQSGFVRRLATRIVADQRSEIATLRRQDARLAADGVRRGTLGVPAKQMDMGTDARALETTPSFDRTFIRAMLPHHEGALAMAKAEIAQGTDADLTRLAERIIAGQSHEIRQMRAALEP